MKYYKYKLFGLELFIGEDNGYITYISCDKLPDSYILEETPLILKTKKELEEYFFHKREHFDIPIKLEGTEFQKRVWRKMQEIPYGKVVSYKELAILSGSPKAARAIGNICHNNKILIIVPCHRVVASNGLGGFGLRLDVKVRLLELEGNNF